MSGIRYEDDGFPECAAEVEWILEDDGTATKSMPYWIKNPRGPFSMSEMSAFKDIADRASSGERDAQKKAARMVAAAMRAGVVAPPYVSDYIRLALLHFGRGEAQLKQAFAPKGRQSKEVNRARKAMKDMAKDMEIVRSVDSVAGRPGYQKAIDGVPGPAFARVAENIGLAPSTVRDRYYKAPGKIRDFGKFRKKHES